MKLIEYHADLLKFRILKKKIVKNSKTIVDIVDKVDTNDFHLCVYHYMYFIVFVVNCPCTVWYHKSVSISISEFQKFHYMYKKNVWNKSIFNLSWYLFQFSLLWKKWFLVEKYTMGY